MKKISTLFEINYIDNHKVNVTRNIRKENRWISDNGVIATRKFDGSACAIIDEKLYKRWDNKKGKKIPSQAIECQKKDKITGHHPFWILCDSNNDNDRYFFKAFFSLEKKEEGTYELCGEKVQGNPEKIEGHKLIKHGSETIFLNNFSFDCIKSYLDNALNDIEGIVFYHPHGMMCKIRKSDFLVKRI